MKRLHFAERVTVYGLTKTDSMGAAVEGRTRLQSEIQRPLIIDRTVFEKTDKEKLELKIEKAHWKKLNRR